MRKWLAFFLALIVISVLHESVHAATAAIFNEPATFHIRPYGLEVIYKTSVNERYGVQWAVIAGASNLVTLFTGYLLLLLRQRFINSKIWLVKGGVFYLTILSLLADPLNLSFGPFIYNGDAVGIAVGLGISRYVIQALFLIVLLVNRELIAQTLFPAYQVHIESLLWRPWIKFGSNTPDRH